MERVMAEQNGNGNGTGPQGPQLNALAQYIKDLSFENPNAPNSLGPQEQGPNISIQVNVNARQLSETDFEVSLSLEGSAGEGAGTLFKFELDYAGVFRVGGIPADQVHPVISPAFIASVPQRVPRRPPIWPDRLYRGRASA
jgi:preprotein translocase subunit SecB